MLFLIVRPVVSVLLAIGGGLVVKKPPFVSYQSANINVFGCMQKRLPAKGTLIAKRK